jgi:hypothetical protein
MDSFYEKINNLYEKSGFLEKFGGSIVMTVIIFLVFFILLSYYYIKSKMTDIQQNWSEEKCNPAVIPFAGLINPPKDGSAMDYTTENFNQCLNNTLEGVADIAMEPVNYSVAMANSFFDGVNDAINGIRDMLSKIRNDIANFSKNVMGRVLSIIMPLLFTLIKMKDAFQKVNGVMGTAIFSLLGAYDTLRSLMNSIAEIIVLILIIIAIVIFVGIGLSYNIFTFPIGITMVVVNTIIFLLILIPFILIEVYMGELLQLNFPSPPSLPTCFSGETMVMKEDGTLCSFKNLKIGDELKDDGKILSVMKLSAYGEELYNYKNINVTGRHRIYTDKNNLKCIQICKDNRFEKIENCEKYLYCIETEKNTITIGDIIFTDWNDLDEKDDETLHFSNHHENLIHNKYSGGFDKNTLIELMDGECVKISNIEVNSFLRYGERVLGIVKIKSDDLDINEYEYEFLRIHGRNIHMVDKNLGVIPTQKMEGKLLRRTKYLYHLITDKQRFHINGTMILDYNSCVDCYLDKEKILSAVLI